MSFCVQDGFVQEIVLMNPATEANGALALGPAWSPELAGSPVVRSCATQLLVAVTI